MIRFLFWVFIVIGLGTLSGCVSPSEDPNRVSTLPWNRPASWEGQGPMGGFTPQSQ